MAHGVSNLLSAGLFVKLSFDIVSPGTPGSRHRPRRARAVLPRCTSRHPRPPQDAPRRIPRGLQKMIKFWCYFNIDFWASWLRFGRPRWLPNRSKIDQNWVSEPFSFRIDFNINFWSIFAPNFDPLDLKKLYVSRKKSFFKKKKRKKKNAFRR